MIRKIILLCLSIVILLCLSIALISGGFGIYALGTYPEIEFVAAKIALLALYGAVLCMGVVLVLDIDIRR